MLAGTTMRFEIRVLISISICFAIASPNALATPLTFEFAGEITTVFPGVPFDSGLEMEVGDVVAGMFTFEPVDTGVGGAVLTSPQAYVAQFAIDGRMFFTNAYEIEVADNASISDFPPANAIDSLELRGGDLEALLPGELPNLESSLSSFRMNLYGPTSSVSHPLVPASASTWNAFDLWRTITVSFADAHGGRIGFQASVGRIEYVPEAYTYYGVWGVGILILAVGRRRRRDTNSE